MSQDINNLFAFWKYDMFPYLLGGTITKMRDDGYIQTVEYGPGNYFKAIKILPLKAGKQLQDKLCKISRDREVELKNLYSEWDKKLKDIIKI